MVIFMSEYKILDNVNYPEDLDKLDVSKLEELSEEIRKFLIEAISKTGGHLASNLGTVELTVAIHKVFDSSKDKILWDVGHQSYTHKILTGRKDKFNTLRQKDGIAGFPRSSESEHDAFIGGHSSNSISAGYGIAVANTLNKNGRYVVCVIGDGSFTGGMVYEAINNAGRSEENIIVILNHNDMSISKNVGAMAKYLSNIRSKQGYHKLKENVNSKLDKVPVLGKPIKRVISSSKDALRQKVYSSSYENMYPTFFEEMGFDYLGPVDGHNISDLLEVLRTAKSKKGPVVVHVDTKKGKGYQFAEKNPGAYHGVCQFDVETGNPDIAAKDSFSTAFGKALCALADNDKKICAVTAAMKFGTGLQYFNAKHKKRFFDVGIAEQHAITFCAGLASQGFIPVFAVYSSFLQRGYDQIIHDCAIENQHIILAVDRAGIVGDDGETHQGVFDVSFLSNIPNVTIFSPESYLELEASLKRAIYDKKGIVAVRYPRGSQKLSHNLVCLKNEDFAYEASDSKKLIITYGRITDNAYTARSELEALGEKISILKLLQIMPIPEEALDIAMKYDEIYFFEEGMKKGGIASQMLMSLYERGFRGSFKITAIDNEFVKQGTVNESLGEYNLDVEGMKRVLNGTESDKV